MKLTIAQGQIRPKKRDYAHNLGLIGALFEQIAAEPPDVLALPETCLSGYFLEGGVIEAARTAQEVLADLQAEYTKRTGGKAPLDITLGFYEKAGGDLYNSSLYATLGPKPEIINIHRKFFLPTYGVFDEQRFVSRGRTFSAFDTRLARSGMLICEDLWHSVSATLLALKGALIVYVGAASPARGFRGEEIDNVAHWKRLLTSAADEHNIFIAFTSLVGFEGGKGLVGNSCLVAPTGEILNQAPTGKEALLRTTIDLQDITVTRARSPMVSDLEATLGDIALEFNQLAEKPGGGGGKNEPRIP
jgi:predicted amidohydrolase